MDEAEKWLKENDPQYAEKHKLEYAYFSDRLMRKKQEKEIPFNSDTITTLAGQYRPVG